MITKITYSDIGEWVKWDGVVGHVPVSFRGRIKGYDNTLSQAHVVVEKTETRSILNNKKIPNDWKDLPSEKIDYQKLTIEIKPWNS